MNINSIRLITGEDLICEVVEEKEKYLKVKNPLQVSMMPTEDGNGFQMALVPAFMPYVKGDLRINKSAVVASVPKDDLDPNVVEHYTKSFSAIIQPKQGLVSV